MLIHRGSSLHRIYITLQNGKYLRNVRDKVAVSFSLSLHQKMKALKALRIRSCISRNHVQSISSALLTLRVINRHRGTINKGSNFVIIIHTILSRYSTYLIRFQSTCSQAHQQLDHPARISKLSASICHRPIITENEKKETDTRSTFY